MLSTFENFLAEVDADYKQKASSIVLFNPNHTSGWTQDQKKFFASVFYHLRGHFVDFMWYIGNFAKNKVLTDIVLENIKEEFGVGSCFSHEKLYERFAMECGVNIHDEIVNETHYLPFAKAFNRGHLNWLSSHDEDEKLSAFAAYERLDNIDYPPLSLLAESLNLSASSLAFFRVHTHVQHFESTLELLEPIWAKTPETVKNAFAFIYSHQYEMWKALSNAINEFRVCQQAVA